LNIRPYAAEHGNITSMPAEDGSLTLRFPGLVLTPPCSITIPSACLSGDCDVCRL
jgi:type 1 fimbria pilin